MYDTHMKISCYHCLLIHVIIGITNRRSEPSDNRFFIFAGSPKLTNQWFRNWSVASLPLPGTMATRISIGNVLSSWTRMFPISHTSVECSLVKKVLLLWILCKSVLFVREVCCRLSANLYVVISIVARRQVYKFKVRKDLKMLFRNKCT